MHLCIPVPPWVQPTTEASHANQKIHLFKRKTYVNILSLRYPPVYKYPTMKYLRLTLLLLLICSFGFAQNTTSPQPLSQARAARALAQGEGLKTFHQKDFTQYKYFIQATEDPITTEAYWQAGLFGGLSFPLGTYRTLPEKAKFNFTGGLFTDRYFKNSRWGIGADIRYLQHGLSKFDNINFANGNISRTNYNGKDASKQHFSYAAFTVGPTFKIVDGPKWQVEAFLRGGISLQHFAVYQKTLTYTPGGGAPTTFMVAQAANDKSNPAWTGLTGLRFTRMLSTQWGLFLQTDYIRTFGKAWGNNNNRFTYDSRNQLKPITSTTVIADPVAEGYYDAAAGFDNTKYANMQAANVTIGLKYIFHKQKTENDPDKAPIVITKDIQVKVKDKQTGQVIENATVNIVRSDKTYTSTSNSNGDAQRVKKALEAKYTISGNKNGIQSTTVEVTAADFANNPGPVIYKEIYIDDIRFTLKGVTVSCDNGKPIAGIITSLRNTKTNEVTNYTSDSSGSFSYQLDPNTDYSVVGNKKGKFSQTELVTTNGLTRSATLYVSLNLKLCDIAKDKVFELKKYFVRF